MFNKQAYRLLLLAFISKYFKTFSCTFLVNWMICLFQFSNFLLAWENKLKELSIAKSYSKSFFLVNFSHKSWHTSKMHTIKEGRETQHSGTQPNDTQHYKFILKTQHNNAHHNDTQHLILSIIILSIMIHTRIITSTTSVIIMG